MKRFPPGLRILAASLKKKSRFSMWSRTRLPKTRSTLLEGMGQGLVRSWKTKLDLDLADRSMSGDWRTRSLAVWSMPCRGRNAKRVDDSFFC